MQAMIIRAISVGLLIGMIGNAIAEDLPAQQVTSQVLVKSTQSWNGQTLPSYSSGQPEVTLLKIQIPPGVSLPLHQHPVINVGVLTKGVLTVKTQSGATLELKAGDPIVEVVDQWHWGENNGTEVAEIMVFYAGVQGKPLVIKSNQESDQH